MFWRRLGRRNAIPKTCRQASWYRVGERLKFLCIVSTNLDEFFEIRVSGLQQRLEAGAAPAGPDMLTPQQALREINYSAQVTNA